MLYFDQFSNYNTCNEHINKEEIKMKFVISTQELNYLINKCNSIVGQKATMPILANFLIEARDGGISITATDLSVGIRCFTDAKVLEAGSTTVPAKKFTPLIKELTSVNVEISTNGNHLTEVVADSSKFKLKGLSPVDYPELPDLENAVRITLPQIHLKEIFYRTSFAVSREDNRYALTGVCMQIKNGLITCVGTDGKRLAKVVLPAEIDPALVGTYIVPHKAVEEIQKCLEDTGTATLFLMDDKIAVQTENTLLITKLLSGDYPDISRVIPESTETVVSLHKEELATLLRQIALFAPEKELHTVKFTFNEGELRLDANTMDVGEGKVSMPVNYYGAPLSIAFNPNFFLDILRHSNKETVNLGLTDAFNPGVITESDEGETEEQNAVKVSPLFVLMPMRLSSE